MLVWTVSHVHLGQSGCCYGNPHIPCYFSTCSFPVTSHVLFKCLSPRRLQGDAGKHWVLLVCCGSSSLNKHRCLCVCVCVCWNACTHLLCAFMCVAFTYACIYLCFSSKGLIAPFGFYVLVLIAAYVVLFLFLLACAYFLFLYLTPLSLSLSLFLYFTPSSLSLFCLTLSFSSFIFLAFPLSVLSSVSLSLPLLSPFLTLSFLPSCSFSFFLTDWYTSATAYCPWQCYSRSLSVDQCSSFR